ncbi:MAG: autotransporter-associated beta strand repeat-containing protein [Thermoguttaceae bacterium]|jgi:autotransporter-associated beta strand protein
MSTFAKKMRRLAALSLAGFTICALLAATASAAAVTWSGSSGTDLYWSNGGATGNWSGSAVPTSIDDVTFSNTGASTGAVTNDVTTTTWINSLSYGQQDAAIHNTQIDPGQTLKITGLLGSVVPNYSLLAGGAGAAVTSVSYTYITGGGTLDVSNASNGNTGGYIMVRETASGGGNHIADLDLQGLSTFNANVDQLLVGANASGDRVSGLMYLAQTNTITLNNPGTSISAGLVIGYAPAGAPGATGTFPTPTVYLGHTNTIYVDNVTIGGRRSFGTLIFNPLLIDSTTILTMRGKDGSSPVSGINIGDNTGNAGTGTTNTATGKMDLTDGNVDIMASMITLGQTGTNADGKGGTGTLTFNKGTINTTGMIVAKMLHSKSPASGTVNVSGTGNLVVGNLGIVLATYLSGGSGTAVGVLNINGGTVTLGADITDGGGTSTIKLAGGTLDMQNHNIGSSTSAIDTLTLASGTLKNVAQINGGGAISKTTAGILTISGANTYSGATTVSAGTLLAEGSLLSFVTVNSGATLGGKGSVGKLTVLSGGTLSTGDSAGKLTVNGDVSLSGDDKVEIDGSVAGTGYDQLQVNGTSHTVTLGGTLTVSATYTPSSDDMFWIILNDDATNTLTGVFSNYASGDLIGAALPGYHIYYNADSTTNSISGGNDVVLAIPEPATLAMLLIAAGLCLMFRRTRGK